MKLITAIILGLLVASGARADGETPLASWPVGTNASGKVLLVMTNAPDGSTNYLAGLYTDAIGDGPRLYPAIIPDAVDPSPFVDKWCFIEAKIEKDVTTNWRRRFRIITIRLLKKGE